MDLCFYQSGHNAQNLGMPYLLAEEMADKYKGKPVINSEPCYEDMGYSRQMYGAAGIYSWHTTNKGFEASLGEGFATPKCWQQALCFEGAWDYGYIKYIFETYDLYGLKAIQELLVKENPEIRIARKDDKIVLYVPHNIDIELNKHY